MGISLEKDYTFIINNVTNSMETDTSIKKHSQKKMNGGWWWCLLGAKYWSVVWTKVG